MSPLLIDQIKTHHVNPQEVIRNEMFELTSEIEQACKITQPRIGECYRNSTALAYLLSVRSSVEVVLGLADFGFGFLSPHGWLRVDGKCYDPTFKHVGPDQPYFEVASLGIDEVDNFMGEFGLPPFFPKACSDDKFLHKGYPSKVPLCVFLS